MNINSKKGFTLVELLAVIVILIVIILIAVTIIKNYTLQAKEKAVEANAIVYVKATNSLILDYKGTDNEIISGVFSVSEINDLGIKISGTKPDSGLIIVKKSGVHYACLDYEDYYIEYNNGKYNQALEGKCKAFTREYTFENPGSYHRVNIVIPGVYKIELYGASGSSNDFGGKGAYTSGLIELKKNDELFFYIGQSPGTSASATFNGGGSCGSNCTAGGGATDVRLVSGDWKNTSSLASRIMVASGGAGYNTWKSGYRGGDGGTLTGVTGQGDSPTTGGTQESAGVSSGNDANKNGSFGKGGNGENYGGGGAGGYWGGAAGKNSSTGNGGSSGSSYISGHTGCVAIKAQDNITPKDGCTTGTTDNSCSIHYSGRFFTETEMIAGNQTMPTHDGTSTMVGNLGNGFARIVFVEP